MKSLPYILPLFVTASLVSTTVHAFNLGKFTDKAAEVAGGADLAGSAGLLSMGSDLLSSFKGNDQATGAAKGLMATFKDGNYAKAFNYYDKIKGAGLKPSQLQTWNDIKNPLSAIILERSFSFEDPALSSLVSKASGALTNNDTKGASNYLGQLKDAATLTSGQESLLSELQSNLLPIK